MKYRCSIATAVAAEQQLSGWILLVDRVPAESASGRVSVWRRPKRLGGLHLQRCVCLFLARPEIAQELDLHTAAIRDLGGDLTCFDIPALRPGDEEQIIATFRDLRNKDCAEIIEECETKFVKEIEFERFRQRRGHPTSLRRHLELRAHDVRGHDARRARTALEIRDCFEHATEAAPNPGAASVRGNVLAKWVVNRRWMS